MRIEKNTKLLLENSNSVSEEEKTLLSEIKNRALIYRLNSRQKLLGNSINLTTVCAFLPLVLGFSHFLNHRSSCSQNFGNSESLFQKNIPAFTEFNPKLNFETFEYLSKSNSRISAYSPLTSLMFGQSKFAVTIKKSSSFDKKKFTGLSCDFYLLTSSPIFKNSNNLAQNLDELPAYVQGLKSTPEATPNFGSQNNMFWDYMGQNKKIRTTSLLTKLKLQSDPKKSLSGISKCSTANSTTKLSLVAGFNNRFQKKLSSEFFLKSNTFANDRFEFYAETKKFNSELKNIFTQKNISCFSRDFLNALSEQNQIQEDFSLLDICLQQNSDVSDELLVEMILQELEKTSLSDDIPNVRFMSGYIYPDMTRDELNWFYFCNLWKQKDLNKIVLEKSALLANSREYVFSVKNFPKISIETNQVSLRNSTKHEDSSSNSVGSVFYTGPALVLDSQRALDWKTASKQNLRSWFHTYISPLNPLRQPLKNFFGVYYSPKVLQNRQIPQFSDFANTSLFCVKWNSPPYVGFFQALEESVIRFSPSNLSFQIPSYTEKEAGETSLIRTLDVNFSKNQKIDRFITLPVLQLQHPSSKLKGISNTSVSKQGTNSLTDLENQVLRNYSSDFSFTSKANPDYQFSTDSFAGTDFVTKYGSGSYTKTASIYSKITHSTHLNVDNWEPLTSTWWLIITQFSFAFFVFQVLKSLADNYGRELLGYLLDLVSSLGILDDSLKQEIEILIGQRDKGFRVILESQKNFNDIVGIQKLLPEIYEVVWFLRNSARDFSLSKTLPRGILLTGPPGTGKTLLVQAIAGEAQVPVVVLSGSSLIEPGESGALKLEKAFQEARELAPCIVFIDEIDTLAQKRSGVVQNPMGPDELVESLTSFEKAKTDSPFERMQLAREKQENEKESDKNLQNSSQEEQLSLLTQFLIELDGIQGRNGVIVIGATNRPDVLDPALLRPGRLEKILQVGLPGHKKRVEILQFYEKKYTYKDPNDPQNRKKQENPEKTKIIISPEMWNYLGDRTAGFTAADLATLMNESAIKGVLLKSNHTLETIEHGIDRLTTSESEKYTVFKTKGKAKNLFTSKFKQFGSESDVLESQPENKQLTVSSKMAILRLAYYQAGKIVLSSLLDTHPKSVVASLWPRRPTIRSAQIATNLQNSIFEFARLSEITDRLVGCYAGKAAEVLFVQQFSSSKYAQLSTLGVEDLIFAQKLVYCILEKWSFYSRKTLLQQTLHLPANINTREFREIPEKIDLYNGVVQTIHIPPMSKALETQTSSLESKKKHGMNSWNSQMYYSLPWWQQQTSTELEFVEKNFTNWSRLYLSNSEQSERNPEWLPPDEYYHSSSGLKNVKKAFVNLQKSKNSPKTTNKNLVPISNSENLGSTPVIGPVPLPKSVKGNFKERYLPQKAEFSWNEVGLLTRDYPSHSLVLESFNKALIILNNNRELLDRLVVELLYKEILRQPEIEKLLGDFSSSSPSSQQEKLSIDSRSKFEPNFSEFGEGKEKIPNIAILESSWGSQSRKLIPRWIDFAEFSIPQN